MGDKKRLLEVSLKDRLSDEEYKKLRAFEREMNAKNYSKHNRKK